MSTLMQELNGILVRQRRRFEHSSANITERTIARIELLENEKTLLLDKASNLANENRELRSKLYSKTA